MTNTGVKTALLDGQTLSVVSYLPVVSGSDPSGPVMATDGTFVEGSHDGLLCVRTLEGEVVFYEYERGAMITQIASDVARSTFAYLVAMRTDDAEVQLRVRRWPFDHNAPHVTPSTSGGLGWAVALDSERHVAAVTGDKLGIWSLADNELVARKRLPNSGTSYQLSWRPGHDEIVLVGNERATGFNHRLQQQWSIDLPFACSVAFAADGRTMAVGSWERGVVGQRT